jgi:Tol biopolymer transport system component
VAHGARPAAGLATTIVAIVTAAAAPGAASAPGKPANGPSGDAAISADGRFVAFESLASDLVRGDTNGTVDVFVRDRVLRTTQKVSGAIDGREASWHVQLSAISPDGRFVVMWSEAFNLVPGDTNREHDVFVHDRATGTTERVSVSTTGAEGNHDSRLGKISADGRFVVFSSNASNLIGSEANFDSDVFVRDRATGRTEHVAGGFLASISADGRFVAFEFPESVVPPRGIAVRDRVLGITELVSVNDAGTAGNSSSYDPTISADGRHVAFVSEATNLVPDDTNGPGPPGADVFVRDRGARTTRRITVTRPFVGGSAANPTISGDGSSVAYTSSSRDPAFPDMSVVVHDLAAGTAQFVSRSSDGRRANGHSYTGSGPISADGRFVAFYSLASNLAAADTNGTYDVFVRDRRAGTTELVSAARTVKVTASRPSLSPKRPRAGRRLVVTSRVTVDGMPAASADVVCSARIGRTSLDVVASGLRASRARCVWGLPRTSAGKLLRGSIRVVVAGGGVTRAFAARIR